MSVGLPYGYAQIPLVGIFVIFPEAPVLATITQTTVTLSAGTSKQLIGANPARLGLRWMVVGTNPMTVTAGTAPATVGAGFNYSPPPATGYQGGSDYFQGAQMPTNAFQAISTSGTVAIVWELS